MRGIAARFAFVKVEEVPDCEPCKAFGLTTQAVYYARLPGTERWHSFCPAHFRFHQCALGFGKGVQYVRKSTTKA